MTWLLALLSVAGIILFFVGLEMMSDLFSYRVGAVLTLGGAVMAIVGIGCLYYILNGSVR